MREYIVTSAAGETIAGMPSPGPGSLIYLTEEQAAYYLRELHIALPQADAPKAEFEEAKPPKAKKHGRD